MLIKVLVVEDDRKIARVVRVYLEQAGYKVTVSEKGREAIELASRNLPMGVVLDLMLPDISGEEVLREIKKFGDIPFIMLTAKSAQEERIKGFALGADDYITKPFNPREMVYRVKAVLKRMEPQVGPEGLQRMSFNNGSLTFDEKKHEVMKNGIPVDFTPSEFRILLAFASESHRVMTRETLIEKAFGYQFEGYDRTIDVHVNNIRRKIEDDPRNPAYIVTVHRVGYKFIPERDV